MEEDERQEDEIQENDTQENIVVELLQQSVDDEVSVDIEENRTESDTRTIIKNANNKFLLDVLSPQIEKNEDKKRKHKDWLMIAMGSFLILQFIIVAIMVCYSGYWIIKCHVNGNAFADSTIKLIFAFIGTYITSVIIELIAILKYIVKNVFDTSIAGMVNNFKDKESNKNK